MWSLLQNLGLGAIIGFFATLLGSFGLYFKRESDKSNKLRKALFSEINQMTELKSLADEDEFFSNLEEEEYMFPPGSVFSTIIYENNASKLGYLKNEEINLLVSYYSRIIFIKDLIQSEHEGNNIPDRHLSTINSVSQELVDDRQKLLNLLLQNSD